MYLDLQTFQQQWSTTNAYLGLSFLKCNENAVFSFKNTYSKKIGPFFFETEMLYYAW